LWQISPVRASLADYVKSREIRVDGTFRVNF